MLDYLRQRIATEILSAAAVTLATNGPAGLQIDHPIKRCIGTQVFLLLRETSEHLINIEQEPEVMLDAERWQMKGLASLVPPPDGPPSLLEEARAVFSRIVLVRPVRFQIKGQQGWGFIETIDLE